MRIIGIEDYSKMESLKSEIYNLLEKYDTHPYIAIGILETIKTDIANNCYEDEEN